MEVILLERIARLGNMGDIVDVKNGFARNFLLPQKKALRATAANRQHFENRRDELMARNADSRLQAEQHIAQFANKSFIIIRAAGETGHLYGSVSPRDIAEIITSEDFAISRNQVKLDHPIKAIGLYPVMISLHPEVEVEVILNVARTNEEALRQIKGEDTNKQPHDDEGLESTEESAAEDKSAAEAEIAAPNSESQA